MGGRSRAATSEGPQERRVWDLLTRDFHWEVPERHPVKVYDESGTFSGSARLQIFEMAVATILAHMRPEFAWRVTPNRPDNGLDFIGVNQFLDDSELGIAAAITVGGQCKKRTNVDDIVAEIAGSLIRMADAIHPTFFVVALSARLSERRVQRAREILERQLQRQCHILDRTQIEGLLTDYLDTVTEILDEGLSSAELEEVLSYFEAHHRFAPAPSVTVSAPTRVLAGVPFRLEVNVRWTRASDPAARLWRSTAAQDTETGEVTLIGPLGADTTGGAALACDGPGDDPLLSSCTVELVTYVVGHVDLGELLIGIDAPDAELPQRVALGSVEVVETMRPRFFDRPYRAGLDRLSYVYDQASTGCLATVGVTGSGGSGKSRMCEEFALEKRRRGCGVLTAKHAKTHEQPHRILGELLAALAADGRALEDPAEDVIRAIARYDGSLAANAAGAIRSVFGTADPGASQATEQSIVSALMVLIVARARRAPLIIHLQDLHWCSAAVLGLWERLVRQLSQFRPADGPNGPAGAGVLFVFEGRSRESGQSGEDAWSSAPFEAFLARVESTTVTCSAFTAQDALTFARRLFEDRHNAQRLLADELMELQGELVSRVCRTAGGNPFHTLEQVRLLKELGVVGQNPRTGLLYMIRPEPPGSVLPDSVFAAVQLRWQYMRTRAPALALLVWGCALLDDQINAPLFHRLWEELAPEVSVREIDATDMLWTADGGAQEVVFRHENYFESIRRFTVSEPERRRVVEAYCNWYAELSDPSPAEQFGWARAMLALADPDRARAKELLISALENSESSGDPRLTQRIFAFYLDLVWDIDERSRIPAGDFLRHCERERDLCRDLLALDRDQGAERIGRIQRRITRRIQAVGDDISAPARGDLLRQLLAVETLYAQLLFNDRRPTEAALIAGDVVASVHAQRPDAAEDRDWSALEMEALYTQSCAQAISGEFAPAVQSSAAAAEIARASQSPLARKTLSTYGTMLLSEDPEHGELVLRECLARWADDETSDAALVHVHLSMALVLQAYRCPGESERRVAMLDEASERTARVHDSCQRLGLYPDAGAAALVRGVASALSPERSEVAWFAQAVAAAARGRQMETLWRSHLNLAMALYLKEGEVSQNARDHALASFEIMQDTLSVYSEPERSPRFEMLGVGLAWAAWAMLRAGDNRGHAVLEQYPTLRAYFSDPQGGVLVDYDGGPRHYQWLRVEDVDFILY